MKFVLKFLCIFLAIVLFSACKKDPKLGGEKQLLGSADTLKINQVQIIASHNSYRLHTDSAVFAFLLQLKTSGLIPASLDPNGLDYFHLPFDQQFNDYGIRGLELDVYYDPNGGLFANRKILDLMGQPSASGVAELDQPGFKMLHIKDVDYNTNYYTFKSGLQAIKSWSDAHPNHFPLFINIETKEDSPADNSTLAGFGFTPAIPYDAAALDALDAEIKAVFGANLDKVITPDKLRKNYATLNDMALAKAWPTIGEARGKIFFIIDGNNVHSLYTDGHPSLAGRVAFIYATPGQAEAAFVIENEPVSREEQIKAEVASGYIVRSRSDADTRQARNPADYSDRDAAFRSGAQIISTDYYRSDPRSAIDTNTIWSDFKVEFPGGDIVRWNPISGASIDATLKIVSP